MMRLNRLPSLLFPRAFIAGALKFSLTEVIGTRRRICMQTLNSVAIGVLAACLLLTALTVSARVWLGASGEITPQQLSMTAQSQASQSRRLRRRNLSIRPEAFAFSQRIGQRFHAPGREVAVLNGTLKVSSQLHNVLITRRQDEKGEVVTVTADGVLSLSWDQEAGARATGAHASEAQNILTERLALDLIAL